MVPVIVTQLPIAGDGQSFAARLNVLGVPPQGALTLRSASDDGAVRQVDDLGDDEVYLNTEAASALGVAAGQQVHALGLPDGSDATWTVKDVTRLGDLGGGEATVFLPLARVQALSEHQDQVNEVLIVNAGDTAQRLQNSWPVTVTLRSAFISDGTARRLYRGLSSGPARDLLRRAIASPDTSGLVADKLRRLQTDLDQPNAAQNPEFKALATDPEVLGRLASRLGGAVSRGNTPFAAAAAGSTSFRVIDVQSVAQDQADRWGSAFTDLFVVLGAFSLFSGMLLIVLVFSLVALERRAELGISRALGARRRDVILLLAIEGGLYSVIASLFGLGAGLALALAIINLAQGLVEQYGFHLEPVIQPTSIAASYGLGVHPDLCGGHAHGVAVEPLQHRDRHPRPAGSRGGAWLADPAGQRRAAGWWATPGGVGRRAAAQPGVRGRGCADDCRHGAGGALAAAAPGLARSRARGVHAGGTGADWLLAAAAWRVPASGRNELSERDLDAARRGVGAGVQRRLAAPHPSPGRALALEHGVCRLEPLPDRV